MSGRLETFLVRPTDGAPEDARREPALPMPKRRAWGGEGSVGKAARSFAASSAKQ